MRFSIITVCYNARDEIRKTIESVKSQSYTDYEYIIVDGSSTDGTIDIIEEYTKDFPQLRYISEKDNGLYDAMNKGLKMSTGDIIEFLNAGDLFCDSEVLLKVSRAYDRISQVYKDGLKKTSLDKTQSGSAEKVGLRAIFYGNIIYCYDDGRQEVRKYGKSCGKAIYYATGDCVNHQACFATKSCFGLAGKKELTADEKGEEKLDFNYKKYKICADRDWMMRQTRSGASWICLDETLVKYSLTESSVSVRDVKQLRKEERMCMKEHYLILYPIYLLFDFCRNNKLLAGILHSVYRLIYIK